MMDSKVIFCGDDILLLREKDGVRLAAAEDIEDDRMELRDEEGFGLAVDVDKADIPEIDESADNGLYRCGLRKAYGRLSEEAWRGASREAELRNWSRSHLFCGKCGGRLEKASEISKKCLECGAEIFPSPSPAVLVLVKRGEEALLVHARNFRNDMFALVAGFVESGETLEECVIREVKEETSLAIGNVRYYGSQSWPFPFQLMVAFTAEWTEGEIGFADNELSAGGWFRRENVPLLPTLPSLSRRLIDAWIEGKV